MFRGPSFRMVARTPDDAPRAFIAPRIDTRHTHGTGCAYSAAITALLARGFAMPDAVAGAKQFVDAAIRTAPGLGAGAGPVNHWADAGMRFAVKHSL